MALQDNYFALTLAICNDKFTPDKAISYFSPHVLEKHFVSDDDAVDMIDLRKTMTYQQVGEIYGLKADAVYQRIHRYLSKEVGNGNNRLVNGTA